MTSHNVDRTTVPNDGKFISYGAACERYGLSRKALRELIRRHGLTTYQPVLVDRRYYLRSEALAAIPSLMNDGSTR